MLTPRMQRTCMPCPADSARHMPQHRYCFDTPDAGRPPQTASPLLGLGCPLAGMIQLPLPFTTMASEPYWSPPYTSWVVYPRCPSAFWKHSCCCLRPRDVTVR